MKAQAQVKVTNKSWSHGRGICATTHINGWSVRIIETDNGSYARNQTRPGGWSDKQLADVALDVVARIQAGAKQTPEGTYYPHVEVSGGGRMSGAGYQKDIVIRLPFKAPTPNRVRLGAIEDYLKNNGLLDEGSKVWLSERMSEWGFNWEKWVSGRNNNVPPKVDGIRILLSSEGAGLKRYYNVPYTDEEVGR